MSTYFSFNRSTWERQHFSDYKPFGWQCGKCGIGQLRADVNEKMLKNRESKTFACHLRCTESQCDCVYYAIGHRGKYDKQGKEISIYFEGINFERWFFPTCFEPTLLLFSCSPTTPPQVVDGLEQAFRLYWINPAAGANIIRTVLERIMDDQSIPSDILHNRLELFKQNNPVNGDRLLAVKWIGNSGSHNNDLQRGDMLDGFGLLAKVLSELYPDTNKNQELDNITNEINSTKKPRSKNT
jgi:hypothetical protein